MRSLLLFVGLLSHLFALEVVEQTSGFVRCSVMYYQDANNPVTYNLTLHFGHELFMVSTLDLKARTTTDVKVEKPVALGLYRKLLATINQARIGGVKADHNLAESFAADIIDGGFSLRIKVPNRASGFDDTAFRDVHMQMADIIRATQPKP